MGGRERERCCACSEADFVGNERPHPGDTHGSLFPRMRDASVGKSTTRIKDLWTETSTFR